MNARLQLHDPGARELVHRRREMELGVTGHVVVERLVVRVAPPIPHRLFEILFCKGDAKEMAAEANHVVHAGLHLGRPPKRANFLALEPLILVHPASRALIREEWPMSDKPRPP